MLYWALVFLIVALVTARFGIWRNRWRIGGNCEDLVLHLSCPAFGLPGHPLHERTPHTLREDFAWRENTHRALQKTLSARCTNLSVAI